MDNPPKIDLRFLEAVEACRPGSENLSDAELRTVYDKLKQTDVVLAEAFHDVPVPEGLADRILDRLASAAEPSVLPEEPIATPDSAVELDSAVAKRGRFWRSRSVLVATVLGTAVSLTAAFVILNDSEEGLTGESVEWAAIMLFDNEGNSPPAGNLISEKASPGSHPLGPPAVAQLSGIRWRRIDEFLGREGVAYDLAPPGSPRATLYVIKRKVPNLRDFPPPNPATNSRNQFAAAWQSGGLLYVLVVDGGAGRYRDVLGMSSRPWT